MNSLDHDLARTVIDGHLAAAQVRQLARRARRARHENRRAEALDRRTTQQARTDVKEKSRWNWKASSIARLKASSTTAPTARGGPSRRWLQPPGTRARARRRPWSTGSARR